MVERTRYSLDENEWLAAWHQGRSMSMKEAVAYALEKSPQRVTNLVS